MRAPSFIKPMECEASDEVPQGPGWLYEIKLGLVERAAVNRPQIRPEVQEQRPEARPEVRPEARPDARPEERPGAVTEAHPQPATAEHPNLIRPQAHPENTVRPEQRTEERPQPAHAELDMVFNTEQMLVDNFLSLLESSSTPFGDVRFACEVEEKA